MVASSETEEDSHAVEDKTIAMPSCIIAPASLSRTGPTIPMSPLSSETKLMSKTASKRADHMGESNNGRVQK
ncbi:hypothetical protein H2248_011902 [Termitomyces sp. 'cryptogamus']|nr:hypothetical protein H2248_011902 [Termitomyces sp. 'cryptogamus']